MKCKIRHCKASVGGRSLRRINGFYHCQLSLHDLEGQGPMAETLVSLHSPKFLQHFYVGSQFPIFPNLTGSLWALR